MNTEQRYVSDPRWPRGTWGPIGKAINAWRQQRSSARAKQPAKLTSMQELLEKLQAKYAK